MITAIWIFVIALFSLWSLTSWGLYQLLALDNQWLGELKPLLERVPFAEWLDRWVPGWQALVELSIDLGAIPVGGTTVSVSPDESWNFQAWHRDVVGGVATSNFTNGLDISFN